MVRIYPHCNGYSEHDSLFPIVHVDLVVFVILVFLHGVVCSRIWHIYIYLSKNTVFGVNCVYLHVLWLLSHSHHVSGGCGRGGGG